VPLPGLSGVDGQHAAVALVFGLVYLGMILGGLPWLRLDRTGVALLGAIAIIGFGGLTPEQAALSIHLPTVLLLFAFMVVSAQMRLGGFYGAVTRRLAALAVSPSALLAAVIGVVALLSAVFSNDIVCLAVAPVLARACLAQRVDPVPYLLALACASNIGSGLTLIGNPQNMLIGEVLQMSFGRYLLEAVVPVAFGLVVVWFVLRKAVAGPPAALLALPPADADDEAPLDRWQTTKGLLVAGALMLIFLFTDWPRDVAALTAAGVLLLSQRFHSSKVLSLIDWELLVLFMGLFVVNHAFQATGLAAAALGALAGWGADLAQTGPLFVATLLLSNLVSNVPAVMLLLPAAQAQPDVAAAGTTLALVSTFAGNLLIVGSIANIIVVDAARRLNITIDWQRHARVGVPVTLATLAGTAAWLAWRSA
jgi:Na+/H+ antiporter NhaD/arsenite permease-like protein